MKKINDEKIRVDKESFVNFLFSNRFYFGIVLIFLLISYWIKITNITISHDTEAIMAVPDSLYNSWFVLGRFGLVFFKKIIGTYTYNPYIAQVLLFIGMNVFVLTWSYLFFILKKNKKDYFFEWIFPLLFLTAPLMCEYFSFLLMSYEIILLLVLMGLIFILLLKWIIDNDKKSLIISVLLTSFCFSCYQAYVPYFITATCGIIILLYERFSMDEIIFVEKYFFEKIIFKFIIVFFVSYILYIFSNKIFMDINGLSTSEYIEGQIAWGTVPLSENIKNVIDHSWKMFSGMGIFYSSVYPVLSLVVLGYSFLQRKKRCYILIIATIGLIVSPLFLTLYLGNAASARSEWSYAFALAFLAYFTMLKIANHNKVIKKICFVLIIIFAMHQSFVCAKLNYTAYFVYQEDIMLSIKISDRIENLGLGDNPKEPVVFLGYKPTEYNSACYNADELELYGRSFFSVAFSDAHGTFVMDHFMNTLGYKYLLPTEEQIILARKLSSSMDNWPNETSVQLIDGLIIVKFC